MKNTFLIALIFLGGNLFAQPVATVSSRDSIVTFYDSLFTTLESRYLYWERIDWDSARAATLERTAAATSFEESLYTLDSVFLGIGGNHLQLFYGGGSISAPTPELGEADFSPGWIEKYVTQPGFEARLLEGKYGYLLIPSMVLLDTDRPLIDSLAAALYDSLLPVLNQNPVGWIIDLRFNTGGSSHPMLLPLYDLLGNTPIWGMTDQDGQLVDRDRLENGAYLSNDTVLYALPVSAAPRADTVPVALLLGKITASSGEIVALSFRGRPRTRFIGETTYGRLTANERVALPFGALLALTVGYDVDRNGHYLPVIEPDERVDREDNFSDFSKDGNVRAAVRFIEEERR